MLWRQARGCCDGTSKLFINNTALKRVAGLHRLWQPTTPSHERLAADARHVTCLHALRILHAEPSVKHPAVMLIYAPFQLAMRCGLWAQVASQKLHAWVDLIFGSAQRGHAAKEACNVFYYLTYEGAADLDGITDPQQRRVSPAAGSMRAGEVWSCAAGLRLALQASHNVLPGLVQRQATQP